MNKNAIALFVLATGMFIGGCGQSAWEQAKSEDTVDALKVFIQQNPDSDFIAEANTRIKSLRQVQWKEVAATNTLDGFVDYVRSGAVREELVAARDAVVSLHDEASGPRGNVELSGMFGSSGMIENADAVATRYEGKVAGMPASVEYTVSAGVNVDGEQQYFAFRDGDNVLSIRGPEAVTGMVEIETKDGDKVRYELFGLVKGPDDDLVGSFLVGRGPDLLWSNVVGMTLAASADGGPQRALEADEAVLFAVHEDFGLVYVP